jgi:hypothetical protein
MRKQELSIVVLYCLLLWETTADGPTVGFKRG